MKICGKPQEVAPWIVVSGLDGSGKTTLIDNLEKYFSCRKSLRVKRFRSAHDEYLIQNLLNVSGSGSPDKDSYTDRLIFILDNRILGTRIEQWRESGDYDVLLSQRGFLDSFVHGAVKGYSYEWTAHMNKIWQLPKCQIIIHLCADSDVAYARIKDDPTGDKFETPAYMRDQAHETCRAYENVKYRADKELRHFFDAEHIFVDTTEITPDETFRVVLSKLERILSFE